MVPPQSFLVGALLLIPILAWAIIVLPHYLNIMEEYSAVLVYMIVSISPEIADDISIFGEAAPAILAAYIITSVNSSESKFKAAAIISGTVTYFLYIHLGYYFKHGPGMGIISAEWNEFADPQRSLLSLISNVRTTALLTVVSLLGFEIRGRVSADQVTR